MASITRIFHAQFLASGAAATGLTVTVDVDRIALSSGTLSNVTTAGSATEGRNGHYYYRITALDPRTYDYVVTFKTAGTADQKAIASLWSEFSPAAQVSLPDAVVADSNGRVDVSKWLGAALASPDTAGYPKVTLKSGTGTGEVDLNAGLPTVNVKKYNGVNGLFYDGGIFRAPYVYLSASTIADDAVDKIQEGLATAVDVSDPASSLLFGDTFDGDGALGNGWLQSNPGIWSRVGGKLTNSAGSYTANRVYRPETWTGIIRAEADLVAGEDAILWLRSNGVNTGVGGVVGGAAGSQFVGVWKNASGIRNIYLPASVGVTAYRLKMIVIQGNRYIFQVATSADPDVILAWVTWTDSISPVTSGSLAITGGNTGAHIDNLDVYQLTPPIRLIGAGDSITAGFQVEEEMGYFTQLNALLGFEAVDSVNNAVAGQTVAGFVAAIESQVLMYIDSSKEQNLVVTLLGSNNIAAGDTGQATFDELMAAMVLVVRRGGLPILGTVLKRDDFDDGQEAERVILNNLILAQNLYPTINFSGIAQMQDPSDSASGVWNPDGIHPYALGATYMAAAAYPVIVGRMTNSSSGGTARTITVTQRSISTREGQS